MSRFLALTAAALILSGPAAGDSLLTAADHITLDSLIVPLPEYWRGKSVGPADAEAPADLVPVPKHLGIKRRQNYLREGTLEAFAVMAANARREGIRLKVQSGYRPPSRQVELILERLRAGRTIEDVLANVAPPGYSEHMLGTTVDVSLGGDYETNPAYLWMLTHAWKFGFYESYPRGRPDGVVWEPWHWRHRSGLSAGGLPPYPLSMPLCKSDSSCWQWLMDGDRAVIAEWTAAQDSAALAYLRNRYHGRSLHRALLDLIIADSPESTALTAGYILPNDSRSLVRVSFMPDQQQDGCAPLLLVLHDGGKLSLPVRLREALLGVGLVVATLDPLAGPADVSSAVEFLIDSGYADPERLAVCGRGEAASWILEHLSWRPDMFRAAVCIAPSRECAPLPTGLEYPATLLIDGPGSRARPLVASLQAATVSDAMPILLRLAETIDLAIEADLMRFLFLELDLPAEMPP